MREDYIKPESEFMKFNYVDIITTSGDDKDIEYPWG